MAHFYFSVNLDENCTLCLAPMSDKLLEIWGEEVGDSSGYFLYEMRGKSQFPNIEIIAHVASDEAALRLSAMMGMR